MLLSLAHCIMQRGSFIGSDLSFYFYYFFEENAGLLPQSIQLACWGSLCYIGGFCFY